MEKDSPPGWGHDALTEFMSVAYQNRFATFVNKKDWFDRLIGIDACFMTISDGWINPANIVSASLLFRCHASFRAACEHATAGQVRAFSPARNTTASEPRSSRGIEGGCWVEVVTLGAKLLFIDV